MSPTPHTIDVDDLEIFYLEAGSGRPVLLLHGGTATSGDWGGAIERLSAGYRVIAPDTRGHGRTSNPSQRLSYARLADDTAGLIRELGLERPIIVGYSDGGQTALEFGLRHPDEASALVLGGTVSEPTAHYVDTIQGWGFLAPGVVDFDRVAAEFGPYFEQIKRAHAYHYGPDYWQPFLRQISELWLTLPHYSEPQLTSITEPTLVISGDRDHLGGVDAACRLYKLLGSGELSIISNAGHEAVNRPLFWDTVLEFLTRHELN